MRRLLPRLRPIVLAATVAATVATLTPLAAAATEVTVERVWTYAHKQVADGPKAEIVAYDDATDTLWIAGVTGVDVLSRVSGQRVAHISVGQFGAVNSVAVKNGLAALAIESTPDRTVPGVVVFYDTATRLQSGPAVAVGAEIVAGLQAASSRYGVPLVGGHTNLLAGQAQLSVAVLGRAQALVSSFAAQPGDRLLMAVDLRGRWMDPFPFWNASTDAPPQRLRAELAVIPDLAEQGLLRAGKDISMAGVLGTLLMLAECSGVGARVALDRLPRPPEQPLADGDALLRWLVAFPSYGYLWAVAPAAADTVRQRFLAQGIACEDIGAIVHGSAVTVTTGGSEARLWDFEADAFITGRTRGAAP